MPTSEANTAALKNTNTALGTEEAESSKANVCIIMTQDQCLDNVHHTTSNIHSANDQVSDVLNSSKNNVVSNGVNNVQEFNVDVNSKRSEHSANVAIVQNSTVDADSPSAGKVLTTREHPASISSDFGDLKENLDNLAKTIDASECANNTLLSDMTVITHQNSSENIRDIIASSDKINKVPNEPHLTGVNNNVNGGKDPVNGNGVHKSSTIKKKLISSKSKHNSKGETDKPEDPVERLNKLRASISSALSEVKGVLKQYSTEQFFDGENESTPSSQLSDDGPVRFRFVRKIRRRSVFSEDDNGKVPENKENSKHSKSEIAQAENVIVDGIQKIVDNNFPIISADAEHNSSTVIEKKGTERKGHEISKDPPIISTQMNQNENTAKLVEGGEKSSHVTLETPPPVQVNVQKEEAHKQVQEIILNQSKSTSQAVEKHAIKFPATSDKNTNNLVETKQHIQSTPVNSIVAPVKSKNTKTKKLVKKDRRASIAAVEINQVLTDKLTPLELTIQRRPSDSGTIVKQTARIKAKTNGKIKSSSQRQTKTLPVSKMEVPVDITPTVEPIELSPPILEESNSFAPNTSISPSPTFRVISTTVPVNVETVNTVARSQSFKIEQSQTEFNKDASAINITKNKTHDLPLTNQTNNSNAVDVNLTQISSELGISDKLSAQVTAKANNKPKLVSQRGTKTAPVIKSDVVTGAPTVPTVVEPSHLIQPHNDDVNKTTIEEPQESDQAIRDPTAATPEKTSTALATELPVKVDAVNTVKVIGAQNQPKSSALNAPNTPAITPDKTLTALINETSAKVHAVNVTNVSVEQNPPKTSASSTSNPPIATLGKASTTPVKLNTVDTVNVIVAQNQSNQSPNTNVLQTENGKTKSNRETPTFIISPINTDLIVTTANLLVENKPEVSDIPIMQVPELSAVPDSIKSAQSEDEITNEPEVSLKESVGAEDSPTSTPETTPEVAAAHPKKKRKAKRKVVIRRIKRKLSKDDTFIQTQETPSELEICEKEIEEKDLDEESDEETEEVPKQRKSCLKARQFEIGDIVMYAERYKKTQVKWRKATVIERITSISYKLDIDGDEKPAHISYIKKFTDRKVNFGGKEYLEIDYAQIEEDEEKERNYSIWNHV